MSVFQLSGRHQPSNAAVPRAGSSAACGRGRGSPRPHWCPRQDGVPEARRLDAAAVAALSDTLAPAERSRMPLLVTGQRWPIRSDCADTPGSVHQGAAKPCGRSRPGPRRLRPLAGLQFPATCQSRGWWAALEAQKSARGRGRGHRDGGAPPGRAGLRGGGEGGPGSRACPLRLRSVLRTELCAGRRGLAGPASRLTAAPGTRCRRGTAVLPAPFCASARPADGRDGPAACGFDRSDV